MPTSSPSQRSAARGVSLPELLVVLAMIGMAAALSAGAWHSYKQSTVLAATAQTVKRVVAQARMRAIFNNSNHFVVLDMSTGTLSIVEDTGATAGVYEADDRVVTRIQLDRGVEMAMPISSLPHPLGSGTVTSAWSLPVPPSGTQWGKAVGLMADTEGRFVGVSATPEVIGFGAVVLNDPRSHRTVGLGVEGRSGTVRAYRYDGSAWTEM